MKKKALGKHRGKMRNCLNEQFDLFPNVFHGTCILKSFYPFPNKPWFLRVCSTSLFKTLWEKEKLLVTSNFSFSHSVFYSFGELSAIFTKFRLVICKLFQFGRVQYLLCGKGLIATFQLSSADSLNLGRSQNGVLGNELFGFRL